LAKHINNNKRNKIQINTAIATAAIEFIAGGQAGLQNCRNVDIMSDAAYLIFTQDSKKVDFLFFCSFDVFVLFVLFFGSSF
jgi:hypothetical protein